MKIKHKGKIFPSPSSVSLPPPCSRDVTSVLRLLPVAIFTLASALSLEDREVLAYMIASSISSSNIEGSNGGKRSSKKQFSGVGGGGGGGGPHKPPAFGCDCFDCYTSFWLRWDSSPNRERIHQVIEAFEEHLMNGEAEASSSKRPGRGKKREKPGRRRPEPAQPPSILQEAATVAHAAEEHPLPVLSTENEASPMTSPKAEGSTAESVFDIEKAMDCDGSPEPAVDAAGVPTGGSPHKGLARKVLPDVLGLLNSRLWNLWNPNV
ncbi:hypothetical protein SAY87_016131 [Trapa incisa]|uniref:Uncharacterized protein n=1 Tax=Trapa incisa TaxID=236973 RepID=A0AAN7LES8_9MYRT|nr:hypothetical protein SAY87_016131 [Trapa incisa]